MGRCRAGRVAHGPLPNTHVLQAARLKLGDARDSWLERPDMPGKSTILRYFGEEGPNTPSFATRTRANALRVMPAKRSSGPLAIVIGARPTTASLNGYPTYREALWSALRAYSVGHLGLL